MSTWFARERTGGYKILYGEALPRGPIPFRFVHHFDRVGTSFIRNPFTYLHN